MDNACPVGLYAAAITACLEAGGGKNLEGKSTRDVSILNMTNLIVQPTHSIQSRTADKENLVKFNENDGTHQESYSAAYRSKLRSKILAHARQTGVQSKQKEQIDIGRLIGYDSLHPPPVDEQQVIIKSLATSGVRAVFPLPSGNTSYNPYDMINNSNTLYTLFAVLCSLAQVHIRVTAVDRIPLRTGS